MDILKIKFVKINIEKKVVTVTATIIARKISIISAIPSETDDAAGTQSKDAQILLKRKRILYKNNVINPGRVVDRSA